MTLRNNTNLKRLVVLLCAGLLVTLSYGLRPTAIPVALIMKVIPDVTRKSVSVDWIAAKKSESLTSGDSVRTGKKALAVIKFMDNSIVRVREQSEVTINGEKTDGKYTKTVDMNNGSFGFEVKKQKKDEQFRLTSPTSVASIRGTKGKLSRGHGNDTLVVTEGLVNLKNKFSNKEIDVAAGFIGFSNEDGSLSMREATNQELSDASSAATGGSTNELNLKMKDTKGNTKDLKIKFKQ
jgi:hypothetical protein